MSNSTYFFHKLTVCGNNTMVVLKVEPHGMKWILSSSGEILGITLVDL